MDPFEEAQTDITSALARAEESSSRGESVNYILEDIEADIKDASRLLNSSTSRQSIDDAEYNARFQFIQESVLRIKALRAAGKPIDTYKVTTFGEAEPADTDPRYQMQLESMRETEEYALKSMAGTVSNLREQALLMGSEVDDQNVYVYLPNTQNALRHGQVRRVDAESPRKVKEGP